MRSSSKTGKSAAGAVTPSSARARPGEAVTPKKTASAKAPASRKLPPPPRKGAKIQSNSGAIPEPAVKMPRGR